MQDLELVKEFLTFGVFRTVDSSKRDMTDGVIATLCSDGDQRRDMIGHLEHEFKKEGLEPRIHPFCLNGGGLLIAIDSPLNPDDESGNILIKNIVGAIIIKAIFLVIIYGHYPCGAAGMIGMSLKECVHWLMKGEERVKEETAAKRVDAFFHVDRGPNFRQLGYAHRWATYFVSAKSYAAWCEAQNVVA